VQARAAANIEHVCSRSKQPEEMRGSQRSDRAILSLRTV
jgi:hypothetical protein